MPDFTHARVCIRHGSGSVEIQAPAGEVTWLDLSGLHARRGRRLLTSILFLGCSAVVGAGAGFMSSSRPFSAGVRAEASALERPALLPELATANAVQVPQALPSPASGPAAQPTAPGADPFGLKR